MHTSSALLDSTNLPDPELAKRIATGDHAAFELLMRRHNQTLYRAARSILRDDAEAEDAVQDAYLLAYRSMGAFRGDAKLSTWLTRIVVNEAIARSRKIIRRAEIVRLDDEMEKDAVLSESKRVEASEQPENSVIRKEARRLLEKKIDALPSAYRTVFMLRALQEMSVEDVATCLNIPPATVRTRFFRARGLLQEALSNESDFTFREAFSFDGVRCDRIVYHVLEKVARLLAVRGSRRFA